MAENFKNEIDETIEQITRLSLLKAVGHGVPVFYAEISVGITGVQVIARSNQKVTDDLNLGDTMKQLADELNPILDKYAKIINEKQGEMISSNPKSAAEKYADCLLGGLK